MVDPGLDDPRAGPLERFRRSVAVPVERYRDADATEQLARVVRPFLLRRRKSDPLIVLELPAKTETDRVVPLTPEQATLYESWCARRWPRPPQGRGSSGAAWCWGC